MSKIWIDGNTSIKTKVPLFVTFEWPWDRSIWCEVITLYNSDNKSNKHHLSFIKWDKYGGNREERYQIAEVHAFRFGMEEPGIYYTLSGRVEVKANPVINEKKY